MVNRWIIRHYSTPGIFKLKWHMQKPIQPLDNLLMIVWPCKNKQKPPSSGTKNFTPYSTTADRFVVHLIYHCAAYSLREASLSLPTFMQ